MKLYAMDRADAAQACRLLIRLNNDCASLQWSCNIQDIPDDVQGGIEAVQNYVEGKLKEFCSQGKLIRELTEKEESLWHQWSKRTDTLRRSLGSGVVLTGKEAQAVQEALGTVPEASFILEALSERQNLVLI